MAEQSAGEKTEQATPRRKLEARKKGTVAKSVEVTGALTMLVLALMGPAVFVNLSKEWVFAVRAFVSRPPASVEPAVVAKYASSFVWPCVATVMPLFLAIMTVGVASNFAQVGFVLSGEPLSPRLDKLNPLPGIKRMFSSKAAFDGVKSFAKMGLFGAIASAAMQERWDEIVRLSWAPPAQAAATVGTLVHSIIVRIAVIWLILAVIDYIFQRKQIDKQLMMTKDELRREMKEQEGSPEVKYAQSQRRRKLAKGGLASKIKQADVIVTNPTHFAVAIKYERNSLAAPMVLAKGVDYLALKMREVAKSEKIPIVENKPLARALYKHCEAGDFVPRHLFGPVAEVLAYVYQSTKKARMRA